ncbi:MAG: hypothetical protein WC343_13745 [Bacilli bacterium]|jgi:hypothetical protein
MNRKLFLEKLSDQKLKELINLLEELDIKGATDSELLRNYADTWYDNKVGIERFACLQIDVYKEATYRWIR